MLVQTDSALLYDEEADPALTESAIKNPVVAIIIARLAAPVFRVAGGDHVTGAVKHLTTAAVAIGRPIRKFPNRAMSSGRLRLS
jgi:hypothetical protein